MAARRPVGDRLPPAVNTENQGEHNARARGFACSNDCA